MIGFIYSLPVINDLPM